MARATHANGPVPGPTSILNIPQEYLTHIRFLICGQWPIPRTMHPSHAGGMALVTNRQMTIATVIMPEARTNTGADTSQISRIAKHAHAYVRNTPDHRTCLS